MGQTTRSEEPATEEEARELRRFLEEGARTSIDEIDAFRGAAGMTAELGRPASIPFRVASSELAGRVREEPDNAVFLTISVDRVVGAGESVVHVFLNKEDANARTPLADSHLAGSFAFFCHPVDQENFVCQVGGGERTELRFRFNVTSVLRRTAEEVREPQATFVVVPIDGRRPSEASVNVSAAELRLAMSVVER